MSNPGTRDDNYEALRRAVYVQRYGQEAWDVKMSKARRGAKLWPVRRGTRRRRTAA